MRVVLSCLLGAAAGVRGDCSDCTGDGSGDNCFHANWWPSGPPHPWDQCSKEDSAEKCAENDGGAWCGGGPTPPGPTPPAPPPAPGKSHNITSFITSYGSKDNCPPGGAIAYPKGAGGIHNEAGGTGTSADPISLASAKKAIPVGSVVYIPRWKKYFIMEDDCEGCIYEWDDHKKYHVDLWVGTDAVPPAPNVLIPCENAITSQAETVTLDPPLDLPVDTTPLYDPATDKCIVSTQPCTDKGDTCGNLCTGPTGSCAELAKLFGLSLSRFEELNPNIGCPEGVSNPTSLCIGGTCGG